MNDSRLLTPELRTPVLPRRAVQIVEDIARIGVPADAHAVIHAGADAAAIECIKDGDVIRAVIVRCSCGSVTHLVCQYEGSSSQPSDGMSHENTPKSIVAA